VSLQPYPKAPGRKETVKGRKTGKFQILRATQETERKKTGTRLGLKALKD
jgi:hypothetical protein